MSSEYNSPGKTTLTPDVFLTITRMSALGVEGVHGMASTKGAKKNLATRVSDGVLMNFVDNTVLVDLFLVLDSTFNIREVSRNVQIAVARAITEMTGLDTGHVNIHIEDIYYKAEV